MGENDNFTCAQLLRPFRTMSIIHYNDVLFLFAVRHKAVLFKLIGFSPD